jgi:hypothetical protein
MYLQVRSMGLSAEVARSLKIDGGAKMNTAPRLTIIALWFQAPTVFPVTRTGAGIQLRTLLHDEELVLRSVVAVGRFNQCTDSDCH